MPVANIPDELETGKVYNVPYFNIKMQDGQRKNVKMHVRSATSLQWKFVRAGEATNMDGQESWVNVYSDGPPGCGKTTFERAYCWYTAGVLKQNVLYIQQNPDAVTFSLLRACKDNNCEICFGTAVGDPNASLNYLISKIGKVSLVVLDGLWNNDKSTAWIQAVATKSLEIPFRIIYTSSMQLDMKWDLFQSKTAKMMQPAFESWSLEECLQACENDNFWNAVSQFIPMSSGEDRKKAVENKFLYAGGSARWMFSYTIEEVCQVIDNTR